MSERPLSECGVVILGGTAGVGLETAVHFAREGSRIALMGRSRERGESACAIAREKVPGVDIHFIRVDAADPHDAKRAEQAARERLGGIDVLICTTGPSHPPQLLKDIPIVDIQARLNEIVLPPLHMMHACLPAMRVQKSGVIVNVASDAAKVPTPGESIIGAAMAAIVTFTRTLAIEAKRDGIRANVLTPSLIGNTDVYHRVMNDPFSAKLFANAAKLAGLGVAQPDDLAALMVFLASPAAGRLTGQAISVNGGISAA